MEPSHRERNFPVPVARFDPSTGPTPDGFEFPIEEPRIRPAKPSATEIEADSDTKNDARKKQET